MVYLGGEKIKLLSVCSCCNSVVAFDQLYVSLGYKFPWSSITSTKETDGARSVK